MTFEEIASISPFSLGEAYKERLLTKRLSELTTLHRQNCPDTGQYGF